MNDTLHFSIWINKLISNLLFPPTIFFIIIACSILFCKKKLLLIVLACCWYLSTPDFANLLSKLLYIGSLVNLPTKQDNDFPQAIVILGGGSRVSPEYPKVNRTVNASTLVRLRYGAFLAKKYPSLPVLVSGAGEANLMANTLKEFNINNLIILEGNSKNTAENAIFSAELLRKKNISKVFLVSHVYHLKRAKLVFEKEKISVILAPTGYRNKQEDIFLRFIPSAVSLQESVAFLHEIFGILWYEFLSYMAH